MDKKIKTLLSKLPMAFARADIDIVHERAEITIRSSKTQMLYVSGRCDDGIRVSTISHIPKGRGYKEAYLSQPFWFPDKDIIKYRPIKVKK